MIPSFDERGNLPPGIHPATWDEIVERYAITERRAALMDGFGEAVGSLRAAGCKRVYLDGSFVTDKEAPGDFDACWEPAGVDPDLLDPELLDFSDRRPVRKRDTAASSSRRRSRPCPVARCSWSTSNAIIRRAS